MSRILVADDESSIRFVLKEALEGENHEVVCVSDGTEARSLLQGERFDFAFLDIRMPGATGMELLEELSGRGPDAPDIVVMTAENTFDNAIEAMKRGAFDYVTKPFDLAQISAIVSKAGRQKELRNEVSRLRRRVGDVFRGGEVLVGTSAAMVETYKTVGRVAQSEAAVLIRGESGTGKELVARAVHYHSKRRNGPFVAVNMSAIPAELIEAELFGHEKGSFTGATDSRSGRFRDAGGGTLLLDEIGDLPLPMQAKLLRVLQEREVTPVGGREPVPIDVRIIAATHQDLEKAVSENRFREDLYFRLNVVPIQIRPLRERPEDIPGLVAHFVERFAEELGVARRWPTEHAIEVLSRQSWPGNVRELENTVKRALVLASGDVIDGDDIASATELGKTQTAGRGDWTRLATQELVEQMSSGRGDEEGPYWDFVNRLERAILSEGMKRAGGNQIQAARALGINRNTLRKKLIELGLGTDAGKP